MKNVLLGILKTEDDYIEIEKIIKCKEKLYIGPFFFAIFFSVFVMLFLIYLLYVLYPLLIL